MVKIKGIKMGIYNRKLIKRVSERAPSIPDESVILWYGVASQIPAGYEIYTELNGYFPQGGSTKDLTVRGSATHTHSYDITAVSWDFGHTHTVPTGSAGNAAAEDIGYDTSGTSASPGHSHGVFGNVTSSGEHRHTLGNTSSGSSIPQHKKLYYIKAVVS